MHALEILARTRPQHAALLAGTNAWSFAQLFREASGMASRLLREYGIRRGDRVATFASNSPQHVCALHALMLLGATCVPLNTRLVVEELRSQIALLRPALLIHEGDVGDFGVDRAMFDDLHAPSLSTCCTESPANDELLSILFTSGSTGIPKAVPHTWRNHRASAEASRANLGVYDNDIWLCTIPLYHIGGLAILTRSLFHGFTVALPSSENDEALEAQLSRSVSIVSLVPTQLHRMLTSAPDFTRESCPDLRAILLGGGSAPSSLWRNALSRGLPVLGTYGSTETCSQVCTVPPGREREYVETAGPPLPGVEIEIRAIDTSHPHIGAQGEIWVRGPMVSAGYIDQPRLNSERFRNGWYRTGDIGMQRADGAIVVLARKEDLIISGGENVHPAEIEEILRSHPSIREVLVTGVEDEEWGQRVGAVISGTSIDHDELERWCRQRLASYKIPRLWLVVDRIPTTASGKPHRAAASALLAELII